MSDPRFAHLDDPAERKWLTEVEPQAVLDNAHRIYEYMAETGMSPSDSYIRELAFQKAATDLGIDYDVLYLAWVHEQPANGTGGYRSRVAQEAAERKYGTKDYWDYLERDALEKAERYPQRAGEFLTRSLGQALAGNTGV